VLLAELEEVYINMAAVAVKDKEAVLAIIYSCLRYKYTL
jgi:hypothetical protein